MKQHDKVFFSVIRSALWGNPLQIPEDFTDWGNVIRRAGTQALNGLVGDVILTSPAILDIIPEKMQNRLRDIPIHNMSVHTKQNNTLILVVTTLRKHGIEPVLLKGQGLASYYPIPELRQCGDIDLYVGEEKYEASYDVLTPMASESDDRSALEVGKHFHLKIGSITIEIHRFADRNPSKTKDGVFREYASKGLKENLVPIRIADVEVYTPADDFNAFYIFNHLWHHFMSYGVGFRQIIDLAVFLNCHEIDRSYLKGLLMKMDYMVPWQVIGCVMVDWLGLSETKMPFYDSKYRKKAELFVSMILDEGNFGRMTSFSRVRSDNYFKEKYYSFKCHISRTFRMSRIVPSHTIEHLYNIFRSGFRQVFKDICK